MTATSADLSDAYECALACKVIEQIGDKIDVIPDWAKTKCKKASAIIDVSCDPPVILSKAKSAEKQFTELLMKNWH